MRLTFSLLTQSARNKNKSLYYLFKTFSLYDYRMTETSNKYIFQNENKINYYILNNPYKTRPFYKHLQIFGKSKREPI
jgi:hypothetical protein